ncbi:hypothetical protein OTK49_21420 [Vibrio coralliirubri]|uniref:hypothetical protein n=1 Tax=Vibrio coralliirubri TaxID=1516159 RepID=UPI002283974B|nr:hypothetical protein [Vibrio coralliirubri]MCY9865082.1 hypothetical protein [Vibrio coralliirubri]
MKKQYIGYKGVQTEILSETRYIIFSKATVDDKSKPDADRSFLVELINGVCQKRITPNLIKNTLELEAEKEKFQSVRYPFAEVVVERFQRYEVASLIRAKSGIVTTRKLYQNIKGKLTLVSSNLLDEMY